MKHEYKEIYESTHVNERKPEHKKSLLRSLSHSVEPGQLQSKKKRRFREL